MPLPCSSEVHCRLGLPAQVDTSSVPRSGEYYDNLLAARLRHNIERTGVTITPKSWLNSPLATIKTLLEPVMVLFTSFAGFG
jgi:hypothetical protein